MTDKPKTPQEESSPIGRVSFACKGKGLARTDSSEEPPPPCYDGPFWDALRAAGVPTQTDPADWVILQAGVTHEKTRERVRRVLATIGREAVSNTAWSSACWAVGKAIGLERDALSVLRTRQLDWIWRQRSLSPAFLALAGAPADRFCLLPDPADLAVLRASWSRVPSAYAQTIEEALTEAQDRSAQQRPWLNRWIEGRPAGLWHWSWRRSQGITPLNGGVLFMQCLWAVYDAKGAVPVVRTSWCHAAGTPCGFFLSHPDCDFRFQHRAWSPDKESQIAWTVGIDTATPETPGIGPALPGEKAP